MESVSVADAKGRFSELIDRVVAGETIEITHHGKPVAHLNLVAKKLKPVDTEMLRRVAEKMTSQTESAGDFIRRMRDSDRY